MEYAMFKLCAAVSCTISILCGLFSEHIGYAFVAIAMSFVFLVCAHKNKQNDVNE